MDTKTVLIITNVILLLSFLISLVYINQLYKVIRALTSELYDLKIIRNRDNLKELLKRKLK